VPDSRELVQDLCFWFFVDDGFRDLDNDDHSGGLQPSAHIRNMVAAGSLFLLCLSASSYHCRHGYSSDVRRHVTPLFAVKSSSSSRSSALRREHRKKSFLSAQIDDGVDILMLDVRQLQWDEKYLLLTRFQEREGHCQVPSSHTEDGGNLGRWVNTQRQLNRKEKLDSERQRRLEEIGFEWGSTFAATWDEMYALLQQFKKREGHCNVPRWHTENGANLGTWIKKQRLLKKKETIDTDRETRLEEIGFEWRSTFAATWDEMYALLQQFKKREGHCNVPRWHTENGANLGTWIKKQRLLKKKEAIDTDRETRLEEIGFDWGSTRAATWDDTYALLKQFKKREGHCNVPLSHTEDGANVGVWVSAQRQLNRKETLDPERGKSAWRKLASIGA
jgi:hypothetical protein